MRKIVFILFCIGSVINLTAQKTTFPYNGVQDERSSAFAVTNTTIFVTADNVIENGTLLIEAGKVVAVGKTITIPAGTATINMEGKYIYPSFIDPFAAYGLKKPEKPKNTSGKPQFLSNKKGAFAWNQAIKPEIVAFEQFDKDAKKAEEWRKLGFGALVSHINDGIMRGTGTLVSLADKPVNELILKEEVAAFQSFNKGISTQNYPSSLMGSIALIKQTYFDADWYNNNTDKKEVNISLQKLNDGKSLPTVIAAADKLTALRADKLGDELGLQYIIKGAGDEYQRADEIKATNASFILPVNFPEAKDVEDPFDAELVSWAVMKHWEMAPGNANFLHQKGVPFCFTANGLKEKASYLKNIKKAIKYGLPEAVALKAMTESAAKILKVNSYVGSLDAGKIANFIITSDSLFKDDAKILENWVQGERYVINTLNEKTLTGVYNLNVGDTIYKLKISGKKASPKFKIEINDSTNVSVKAVLKKTNLSLSFAPNKELKNEKIRLSGWFDDGVMKGKGQLANGEWIDWLAEKTANKVEDGKKDEDKDDDAEEDEDETNKDDDAKASDKKEKEDEDKEEEEEVVYPTIDDVMYPFVGYGWKQEEQPKAATVLITNATVWTNEKEGILEDTDVLIKDGKISKIGEGLKAKADVTIDGTDKHLTAGIIDEHSHIAISRGVNEWTQQSSAEVSIADVINCDDVNIYRQLAGGVTAAQLLHGSANPIGGQSALIKLRWGAAPEAMKIEGADPFIKFALGENVKQANWGDDNVTRFPQSRMGVEQVFVDHFTRALEYQKDNSPNKRKDLELETLLQIIQKQRFITCHSYVQSEITMLMRVAEQFGFNINTFTHILEGYKIADKMKAHGVAASTFSDWWRYKYEVMDAIPYNAAILDKMEIVTALNSDDAEMARRLNEEAAKAIKYGGTEEEAAFKMITLNPAKMLHLDDKMGSIKTGKDADVVLWSDHPLSVKAKAEKTFVDGILYFDIEADLEKRKYIAQERNRLIQKMIAHKNKGGKAEKPKPQKQHLWHCDDLGNY